MTSPPQPVRMGSIPAIHSPEPDYIMQGWLLKKKRKKMQGMARRYFWLTSTGVLSYSFNPNSPIRDEMAVPTAFVSANQRSRTIHLDSGKTVYHVKALSTQEFNAWTACIKRFIHAVVEDGKLGTDEPPRATSSPAIAAQDEGDGGGLAKVLVQVEGMAGPLQDLDALLGEFKQQDFAAALTPSPQHSAHTSAQPSPSKPHGGASAFRFLGSGRRASSARDRPSPSQTPVPPLPPPVPGSTSASTSHFSGNGHRSSQHLEPNHPLRRGSAASNDSAASATEYFDAKPTPEQLVRMYAHALATLKAQHHELLHTVRAAQAQSPSFNFGGRSGEREETGPLGLKTYAGRSSAAYHRHTPSRASSFSIASGETDYEDALPGEFVLEEEDSASASEAEEDKAGDDTDDDDDEGDSAYDSANNTQCQTPAPATPTATDKPVVRRTQLPHPIAGDEFSMLGLLRKNVGKDLSTISFPVTMNEPLSALQRICEELEYADDLLHRAAAAKDSIERLVLVTTFAIAGNSGNKYRSSRKPFNPLLGETYEAVRPDKGFKFVGEKVSHHPPVMAFHTDSPGWQIDGFLSPSQKFWGRSMEIMVAGDYSVSFPDTGDKYNIRKPSSFVRNLVAGTKYLEVVGDLHVTNDRTGEHSVVHFKEGSSWGGASTRNKVEGKVMDAKGGVKAELAGRWDEAVDRKEGKDSFQRLWTISEFPPHPEKYYGFSKFTVELNEVTALEEGKLPSTDSRLRPDQLALERGDVDGAEREKLRVEEKQRAVRKQREEKGEGQLEPKWFEREGEGWRFGGAYWEAREKQAWPEADIF